MHYAVHGHTAAELIVETAESYGYCILRFAENMTLRHIPLTTQDWEKRLNSFIEMFDYGILQDAGKVSVEIAKLHAETEFEKYRVIQDRLFMSDFDKYMLELEENAKK